MKDKLTKAYIYKLNKQYLHEFEQYQERRTKLNMADIDNLITIGELDPDVCKEVWEFTQTSTINDSYRFVDKSWAEITMPFSDADLRSVARELKLEPGFDEFGNTELDYYGEGWDLILSFKGKDDINHLGDDKAYGWTDELSDDKWSEYTDQLSDEDLILLFKGLAQVENVIHWNGPYENADLWVHKVIRRRGLDQDNKISDFTLGQLNR